jgi:hypothetical protein
MQILTGRLRCLVFFLMADERWPMSDERCPMSDVRCPMADDRWPLTDVRWPTSGWKLCYVPRSARHCEAGSTIFNYWIFPPAEAN